METNCRCVSRTRCTLRAASRGRFHWQCRQALHFIMRPGTLISLMLPDMVAFMFIPHRSPVRVNGNLRLAARPSLESIPPVSSYCAIPATTASGLQIEGKEYIVTSLILQYKLQRGRYVRDHCKVQVPSSPATQHPFNSPASSIPCPQRATHTHKRTQLTLCYHAVDIR